MFTNIGRDVVFSADLCYNGHNRKPPLCKGRWQPKADGGIVKISTALENNPSVANATAPIGVPRGRAKASLGVIKQGSLWTSATLGVWALPEAFVIQRRNWR